MSSSSTKRTKANSVESLFGRPFTETPMAEAKNHTGYSRLGGQRRQIDPYVESVSVLCILLQAAIISRRRRPLHKLSIIYLKFLSTKFYLFSIAAFRHRRPFEFRMLSSPIRRVAFSQIMKEIRWMKIIVFMSFFILAAGRASKFNCPKLKIKQPDHSGVYNHTFATIIAEYASAVYLTDLTALFTWTCSRCNGLTKGFEVIELIVDVKHCLQAYVGFAKNLNAVVVAFRGTQWNSVQNWVQDLYWKQLDLPYPDMSNAMVHHGFYFAYHNTTVRPAVINAIKRAKELYGKIDVVIAGHSMGGAMAAFCALDLTISGVATDIQVMTFGQPRIGNSAFVAHYSQRVPRTIRVTHEHDIVPHLPPYYHYFSQKTYHHFPREVWIHSIDDGCLIYTLEELCDTSGEDPSCSKSVLGHSISDHLRYYGLDMGCYDLRTCKIVVDPGLDAFSTRDSDGNLIFSRDPIIPFSRFESNIGSSDLR